MSFIKDLLFWWMLLENVAIVVSKKWRKDTIQFLIRMDKRH